jgi:hypothetical protein
VGGGLRWPLEQTVSRTSGFNPPVGNAKILYFGELPLGIEINGSLGTIGLDLEVNVTAIHGGTSSSIARKPLFTQL